MDIPHFKKLSFLPGALQSIIFLPSAGASGGVITAWDQASYKLAGHSIGTNSVTTLFRALASDLSFSLTNVYGPCAHDLKPDFLSEISTIASHIARPWAIVGDFNLICSPDDKSSDNFDAHEADLFNSTIDDLCLVETPLLDRLFTWTNNQPSPTLVRLDRSLVNTAWNTTFPDTSLKSLTRTTSDHILLLLSAATNVPRPAIFRLNNHWLSIPSFSSLVLSNWSSVDESHPRATSSSALLCLRLKRIRCATRAWGKRQRPLEVLISNCELMINLLDLLEERRHLSRPEFSLRSLIRLSLGRLVGYHD